MKSSKLTLILTALLLALLFTSCQSIPKDVPEDLTKADIIQLAQDSYEDGNKAAARYYYELLAERFNDDPTARIIGQYEIAHIYIKDEDYKKAKPILEEIIAAYDDPAVASAIPEYLKLAKIDLAKCE